VLAVIVIVALIGTAAGVLLVGLGRRRRFDEVERFHRASAMTTEWARRGVTSPVIATEEPAENAEESARHGGTA
jgi:type II secretory pathway pseudopilin PulG